MRYMRVHTVRFLLTADVLVDVEADDVAQADEIAAQLAFEAIERLDTTVGPVRIIATRDDLRPAEDEDGAS